jgi:hypothetical protein
MLELSFYPYAVILQVTPIVSIAPLIFIYVESKVAGMLLCAWLVAFFPVLSSTTLGLNSVDHNLRDLFRIYGASALAKAALPAIALRPALFPRRPEIAGGLSLIGAVVAELVAGTGGHRLRPCLPHSGGGLPAQHRAHVRRPRAGRCDGCVHLRSAQRLVAPAPQEVARKRRQPGNLMDFRTIPQGGVTLANVTIPACLLGQEGDLIRTDISIADGRIAEPQAIAVDMGGAMAFPAFVDMHTHLDKGHIWPRSPNPDGSSWARSPPSAPTVRRQMERRGPAPPHVLLAALRLRPWHARDPHASRQHRAAGRHHLARLPGASGRLGRPDRPCRPCA